MPKTDEMFGDAVDSTENYSEDEESIIVDDDICTNYEIEQTFQQKYKIIDETAVSLKKDYVLSLCSDNSFSCVAAGLSNGEVQIFNINLERGLTHASSTDSIPRLVGANNEAVKVCGVRFLDETPNSLLIGTTNGVIRLFDLRTNNEQARIEDTSDAIAKPITTFDRNANSRVICAGTEQIQKDVYLLFYDVRQRKQMGGYFDSHQDDVTSVCFHEKNPDLLCIGSVDGLINIFNIEEETEDDALTTTINTESSVHKLKWHKNVYEKDIISCITHTNDFHVYECEEGDLVAEFDRAKITESMKRKSPANCNLVDCHSDEDGNVFLLAGTNLNKGDTMRSLRLQNKRLLPFANFEGNKQIVRESIFNSKSNALITAGESGIVTLWTPVPTDQQTTLASSSHSKLKAGKKSNKRTPY